MKLHPRVRQALDHLSPRLGAPALPDDARALLTEEMERRFRQLPVADQRHLLATFRALRAAGAAEETCVAGLLHDIGKSADGHRIGIADRTAKVLLRRFRPAWLEEIAAMEMPSRPLRGLHRAVAHPRIGAELAADAGYGPRVCWLIRHHEDTHLDDPELRLLVAADDAADSTSPHFAGDHAAPVSPDRRRADVPAREGDAPRRRYARS